MEDLETTLIDVYETLRYQQELSMQAAVRVQAVTTVLMHVQGLAELYPKELEKIETTSPIAEKACLMLAAIESKLRSLREHREHPNGGLVQ
jgi:hypothetical protein